MVKVVRLLAVGVCTAGFSVAAVVPALAVPGGEADAPMADASASPALAWGLSAAIIGFSALTAWLVRRSEHLR